MRVYNFSGGPAALPLDILEHARGELTDCRGTGMSVMEMSHRSSDFMAMAEKSEADLRKLLEIPKNYSVLFVQGGATTQFAAVPLNLAEKNDTADYVVTGHWSQKAVKEAGRFVDLNLAADASANGFTDVPDEAEWARSKDAAYLHYTPNETIHGVEFPYVPDAGDVPLVADMSSTLLSRPLDVTGFGVIYAGAQKNIGPPGLTLVIVREDLLGRSRAGTPVALDYEANARAGSMLNTPPTFVWYMAGLNFAWLLEQGGLKIMADRNQRKATRLYAAIDESSLYTNPVQPRYRSWMNIPFVLTDSELDKKFLEDAFAEGLANLEGHRSVGGMRASIYNAMPEEGVDALVGFMQEFERRYG